MKLNVVNVAEPPCLSSKVATEPCNWPDFWVPPYKLIPVWRGYLFYLSSLGI
jgi:hypothetical protein